MTALIHAEVGVGGRDLVLVAGAAAGDVAVAHAAKLMQTLTPLFSVTDPAGGLTTPLTWPAIVQLQRTFGASWRPGPRLCSWIEQQILARAGAPEHQPGQMVYRPPAGLTPYPWQVDGAAMIARLGRVLLTDEPGTGKTITTILGLVEWDRQHTTADTPPPLWSGPVLVVCPASVIDAWVTAWQVWAPHVRAVAWRGPAKKRRALIGTADIYVTSYDTARVDAAAKYGPGATARGPLLELQAGALVIDECHLIKNQGAARSQAVRRLAKRVTEQEGAVVALSGTPITHHPGDLWPTLNALEHDAWPSRKRWVDRYCVTLQREYDEEILGLAPAAEEEFRLATLGQHRRVAKADVLSQLPPKVYSVRTVELPPVWRKAYDDFEGSMLAELPDGGGELSVMDVLAMLTHLSGLAAAPADVQVTEGPDVDERTGEPKRHVHLELKAPSWKVAALLEVLEERCAGAGGEQVVAFAPSRQLIDLAGAAATAAGYRVGYVVGGQAPGQRTAGIEAFQRGELDLMCVTTAAGGVGITLTAARTAVFLQRPWSLVEATQAEDRLHRIGAEHHESIEVIDIVARDTVDARVRAVLRERAGQLADLVQDQRLVTELLGGTHTDPKRGAARDASTPHLGQLPATDHTSGRKAS